MLSCRSSHSAVRFEQKKFSEIAGAAGGIHSENSSLHRRAFPSREPGRTQEAVFESLSQQRHCSRLPQILQALQPEDTAFLQTRGRSDLVHRLRTHRKQIALRYLDLLQQDFECLLEASRVLAVMSPEVVAMQEAERLKLSIRFAFVCRYLRWKLRLGLAPWNGFGKLAAMASGVAMNLEQATKRLGECAALAPEFPSILENRGGDPN